MGIFDNPFEGIDTPDEKPTKEDEDIFANPFAGTSEEDEIKEAPVVTTSENEGGFLQSVEDIAQSGTIEPLKDFSNFLIAGATEEAQRRKKEGFLGSMAESQVGRQVRAKEAELGRDLTDEEREEIRASYDPQGKRFNPKYAENPKRFAETMKKVEELLPDLPERDRSRVTQALMGMARFAPSMIVGMASGGAGFAVTAAQVYGQTYGDKIDQGYSHDDAQNAAAITALLSTPVEFMGNVFQVGMLKNALKGFGVKPAHMGKVIGFLSAAGKTVPGSIAKAGGRTVMGSFAEGSEEFIQAYAELIGDIVADMPDATGKEMFDEFNRRAQSEEFKKQRNESFVLGALGGGGTHVVAAPFGVAGDLRSVKKEEQAKKEEALKKVQDEQAKEERIQRELDQIVPGDVAPGKGYKATEPQKGITLLVPEEETAGGSKTEAAAEADTKGIPREILSGIESSTPGVAINETADGPTDGQAAEMLKDHDAKNNRYDEIVATITRSERAKRMAALQGRNKEYMAAVEDALDQQDYAGATGLLNQASAELEELNQHYVQVEPEIKQLAKIQGNEDLIGGTAAEAGIALQQDMQLRAERINTQLSQIKKIQDAQFHQRQQALINRLSTATAGQLSQVSIDTMNTFKKEGNTLATKTYEGVAGLQQKNDQLGQLDFNEQANFNELLKLKLKLKEMSANPAEHQLTGERLTKHEAMQNWIDEQLLEVQGHGMLSPTEIEQTPVRPKVGEATQAKLKEEAAYKAEQTPDTGVKVGKAAETTVKSPTQQTSKLRERIEEQRKKRAAEAEQQKRETDRLERTFRVKHPRPKASKEQREKIVDSERSRKAQEFFQKEAERLKLTTGAELRETQSIGSEKVTRSFDAARMSLLSKITKGTSKYDHVYQKLRNVIGKTGEKVVIEIIDQSNKAQMMKYPAEIQAAIKSSNGLFVSSNNAQTGRPHHIFVNVGSMKNMKTEVAEEALAHEILHALVRIRKGREGSAEFKALEMSLQKFWDGLTADDKQLAAKVHPKLPKLVNLIDEGKQPIDEIVTYAFTNGYFADWLNRIPVRGEKTTSQSMWAKLKDIILSKISPLRTKLDELSDLMDTIMPEHETRAAKSKATGVKALSTVDEMHEWLSPIVETAPGAAPTVFVQSVKELPDSVQAKVQPGQVLHAVWHNGTVYMIGNGISSKKDAVKYWMHEQVGHQSLRSLFSNDKRFKTFLNSVHDEVIQSDNTAKGQLAEIAKLYGLDLKNEVNRHEAVEEWLASRAETMKPGTKRGVLRRFMDLIKSFFGGEGLTMQDVDYILEAARGRVFGDSVSRKLMNTEKAPGSKGSALGRQIYWDWFEIKKAAGRQHPVKWLEENGWKGQSIPKAGLSLATSLNSRTPKEVMKHRKVVSLRNDIATGKLREGTPEYDKALQKYGSELQGFTIRHTVPFLCSNKKMYGPKGEGVTARTTTKNHHLLGPIEVTEYYDKDGYLVMDTPLFSTDDATRAKEIDAIIKKNAKGLTWYENWNKFIMDWPGLDQKTKEKFVKIMGVLSAGQGPQGNQLMFTNVINYLNEKGPVVAGNMQETGLGIAQDAAEKINEIWEERDFFHTLEQRQQRYGAKVGAYITAGLAPNSPGAVVIDRHMPRPWGYDITWSPNGQHTGFQVDAMVEEQIVREISEAAVRNNVSPAGVQAAIWYATRAEDIYASEYQEAALLNPSRFLPHVMHKGAEADPQYMVHYAPEVLDVIKTNKLEDNTTNSYSQGDVQNRKYADTPGNPYVPMGYFYGTLETPEGFVKQAKKPHAVKTGPGIYDAIADQLNVWKQARNLVKFQGGDLSNAFGNILKKAGYVGAMIKSPYKGGKSPEWFVMFGDTAVTAKPETATVRMSEVVEGMESLPQDLEQLAEIGEKRQPELLSYIRETMKEYPDLRVDKELPTVARFGDATSGSMEHGMTLEVTGPSPSIKAWAAKNIGLGRGQRGVLVEHPDGEPNGTRFRFRIKKGMDLKALQEELDNWGITDYNLAMSATGIELDTFVLDGEGHDSMLNVLENFAKEHGQVWPTNGKYRTFSDFIGAWDTEVNAQASYLDTLENYHGKLKGRTQFNEGLKEGSNYKTSIRTGNFDSAHETSTNVEQGDGLREPTEEQVGKDEVRFAASFADMTMSNDREFDKEWLNTNDEALSFTNRLWAMRDQVQLNVARLIGSMEQDFLRKFGGRKARLGAVSSGKLRNTAETELLREAMNLHIDSGNKLQKVQKYRDDLAAKPKLTVEESHRLQVIDRMLSMTADEKLWAARNIKKHYDEMWQWANDHDLINGHHEDYVRRVWNIPEGWHVGKGSPNGYGGGFQMVSDRGKTRTLDSIIDGWERGDEWTLRQNDALVNLQAYMEELGNTAANRRFVNYGKGLVNVYGQGIFEEDMDLNEARDRGYKELDYTGFQRTKADGKRARLYARRDIADIINKATANQKGAKFWDAPAVKMVRRINSGIKATVLSVSLFHHFAGWRSWAFGVKGLTLGQRLNPVKAYKSGLQAIEEKITFESIGGVDYSNVGAAVDLLVRNGLTIGKTQDFEGDIIRSEPGLIESLLTKAGATKGVAFLKKGQRFRRQLTTSLFGRFFAGLKAEAGMVELRHRIETKQMELGRGLNETELNTEAEKVARLINADFGGLHTQRMGRDVNLQRVAQMLLLAPDWTESNFRTVTGMVPGLNKLISKAVRDNPPPAGMDQVYRTFWAGIILRGVATLALANIATFALPMDDDDDTWLEFYKKQFSSWDEAKRLRWTGVPLERWYGLFGLDTKGKKPVFQILGHFTDPLKLAAPLSLLKGKGSPIVRHIEGAFSGTDWKGTPYQGVSDWVRSVAEGTPLKGGLLKKRSSFDRPAGEIDRLPAYIIDNLIGAMPIPIQEFGRAMTGDELFSLALAKSVGLHIGNSTGKSLGEIQYEKDLADVNEADKWLKDAQAAKDLKGIVKARGRLKELNRLKSRVGYSKGRINSLKRQIDGLEAKAEKSDRDEARLEKLKLNLRQVYDRYLKVRSR